jgi:hypothetical protein
MKMKLQTRGVTRTILFAIALFVAGWCRAEEEDQILFLHLKLKDDGLTLVNSSVKRGRLKTPLTADKKGEIHLELTAADGSPLWSDVLADPRVQRLEYEDPDKPGALKVKEVRVAEVEFTVRVPFHKEGKRIKLYRLDRLATRTEALAPGQTKKLLGAVAIPASGTEP